MEDPQWKEEDLASVKSILPVKELEPWADYLIVDNNRKSTREIAAKFSAGFKLIGMAASR